jgi:hypothetical protein
MTAGRIVGNDAPRHAEPQCLNSAAQYASICFTRAAGSGT